MHPIFSSARTLGLALAFWGAVACLICIFWWSIEATRGGAGFELALDIAMWELPWYGVLLFFCLPGYTIAERLPFAGESVWQAASAQVLGALLALALWWFAGGLWFKLLKSLAWLRTGDLLQPALNHLLLAAVIYSVWTLWHLLYLERLQGSDQNQDLLQQRLLVSEVELQAIKVTLHPHFLYNSLNMLADLALIAPDKMRNLCVRLAEFLRYSLRFGERRRVSLDEEIAHVENYLEIEQERCGERLQLKWQVAPEARSCAVFPLLLLPLAENAVKHGIGSALEAGEVEVRAQITEGRLNIEVRNSYDPLGVVDKGTGHGLRSLRKRLQSHYGALASMWVRQEAREFSVQIALPVEELKRD